MKHEEIVNSLHDFRMKHSVTQEELAKAVGVTRQTIISIEKGNCIPSIALAMRISHFFSVCVEDIFIIRDKNKKIMNKHSISHQHGGAGAVVIGIIALIVVIGIVALVANNNPEAEEGNPADGNPMIAEDQMNENKDDSDMMDDTHSEDDFMVEKDMVDESELSAGSYEDYSPEKLSRANGGDVVLFFHAAWCPTCRTHERAILEEGLSDGVTILKVDYDTETELKKKYGVVLQHSFVQVDADGNEITKWAGGRDLDDIISRIK